MVTVVFGTLEDEIRLQPDLLLSVLDDASDSTIEEGIINYLSRLRSYRYNLLINSLNVV